MARGLSGMKSLGSKRIKNPSTWLHYKCYNSSAGKLLTLFCTASTWFGVQSCDKPLCFLLTIVQSVEACIGHNKTKQITIKIVTHSHLFCLLHNYFTAWSSK